MHPFYLSFADTEGFLGACIVTAPSLELALQRAKVLGIHPGGEVRTLILTRDGCHPGVFDLALQHQDKLLSKADLAALFGPETRTPEEVERDSVRVCEPHVEKVSRLS